VLNFTNHTINSKGIIRRKISVDGIDRTENESKYDRDHLKSNVRSPNQQRTMCVDIGFEPATTTKPMLWQEIFLQRATFLCSWDSKPRPVGRAHQGKSPRVQASIHKGQAPSNQCRASSHEGGAHKRRIHFKTHSSIPNDQTRPSQAPETQHKSANTKLPSATNQFT
jgi:hypothetical protein